MTTSAHGRLKTTRSLILGAGVLSVSGIALSATGSEDIGKWLTLLGVGLLVLGLHRFGRSGPDAPLEFAPAEPKRKRRKKRARPSAEDESGSGD